MGRLEPGLCGDVVVIDLRALRAPFAAGEAEIWELLLARGRAVHVDSTVVGGRVLMRGRRLLHVDRDALMEEVAAAAAAAVARRTPEQEAWIAQLGQHVAGHYQAPLWHDG
jgi:5-methylthioadenosine/S-adenosylhomocysteine deaminase